MSLVRNTAPCFVSGSVLLVFVMVNTNLRIAGDGQSVLRIVAVAVRPAGLAVPLLDVDARCHVRGAGPRNVGFEVLAVVVLRELILVAVGHGEALALDVGAPAGLMGVVRNTRAL